MTQQEQQEHQEYQENQQKESTPNTNIAQKQNDYFAKIFFNGYYINNGEHCKFENDDFQYNEQDEFLFNFDTINSDELIHENILSFNFHDDSIPFTLKNITYMYDLFQYNFYVPNYELMLHINNKINTLISQGKLKNIKINVFLQKNEGQNKNKNIMLNYDTDNDEKEQKNDIDEDSLYLNIYHYPINSNCTDIHGYSIFGMEMFECNVGLNTLPPVAINLSGDDDFIKFCKNIKKVYNKYYVRYNTYEKEMYDRLNSINIKHKLNIDLIYDIEAENIKLDDSAYIKMFDDSYDEMLFYHKDYTKLCDLMNQNNQEQEEEDKKQEEDKEDKEEKQEEIYICYRSNIQKQYLNSNEYIDDNGDNDIDLDKFLYCEDEEYNHESENESENIFEDEFEDEYISENDYEQSEHENEEEQEMSMSISR